MTGDCYHSCVDLDTAPDLYDRKEMSLVVVELKCGFSGWRTCSAREEGKSCNLKGALKKAADNTLNRHMS